MPLRSLLRTTFFLSLLTSYPASPHNQGTPAVVDNQFIVNFISMGAGIDHKAEQRFLDYLSQFQMESKVTLPYKTEHWGKEGETKYSFDLKSLSKKQRKQLKDSLTKIFEGNKLVQMGDASP